MSSSLCDLTVYCNLCNAVAIRVIKIGAATLAKVHRFDVNITRNVIEYFFNLFSDSGSTRQDSRHQILHSQVWQHLHRKFIIQILVLFLQSYHSQ